MTKPSRSIHVIIPTYQRPACIADIIEKSFQKYNGDLFCFSIYDSSTDNDTKIIIEEFIKLYPAFPLKYYHVDEHIQVDEKTKYAISQIKEEYFYVLGDGVLVDYNILEKNLLSQSFFRYCVINIEHEIRKTFNNDPGKISEVIYPQSHIEFVRRFFSHMTFWGATIVKTSLYFECQEKGLFDKYFNEGLVWWIAAVESEILVYEDKKHDSGMLPAYMYTKAIEYSKFKKDHSWVKGERYYLYVFSMLNRTIELLPEDYKPFKNDMIRSVRRDSLATRQYLMHLRSLGTITIRRNHKFREDIKIVPGWYDYMMALCFIPVPLIKAGKSLKHFIVRLVR